MTNECKECRTKFRVCVDSLRMLSAEHAERRIHEPYLCGAAHSGLLTFVIGQPQ